MKIELEEIVEISPKLLLWNKLPDFLDESMIIEFLKNDVLMLEYSTIEEVTKINAYIIACILNLDQIFKNENENKNMLNMAKSLLEELNTVKETKKIIMTSRSYPNIKKIFKEEGLQYFELKGKKETLLEVLKDIACPRRSENACRTNLRLHFKPEYYKVAIKIPDNSFNGYINDLSFSGMGIVLERSEDFKKCKIGSFMNIKIDFKVSFLIIAKGMIIRKDKKRNLIGIQMDAQDKHMVDNDNAIMLKNIIDTWVAKIVQSRLITIENKGLFT